MPDFKPRAKSFVALTLAEEGARGCFTYLPNGKTGDRYVYFVNVVQDGRVSGTPMLLGQFLFEFEGDPERALPMEAGCTNRIYYPGDKRVSSYDPLTPAEIEDTRNRLQTLAKRCPEHIGHIEVLQGHLER